MTKRKLAGLGMTRLGIILFLVTWINCLCRPTQAEEQYNRRLSDAELREQFQRPSASVRPWLKGGLSSLPEWIKRKQPRPEPRRLTFTWCKHWKKGDSLLPFGLLGPVRLVPYTEIDVVKANF